MVATQAVGNVAAHLLGDGTGSYEFGRFRSTGVGDRTPGDAWLAECGVLRARAEQNSDAPSSDDVYKDWLALRWPYPTICQAAGNGADGEFVNHKGFNRLAVGNHNDTASAIASDTCFRNPTSSHGDPELPEIAANGIGVTTVGLTMSGTSMAAPAVAGAAACIQQVNGTLRSWPEGCRAILMAGAWRNPLGGTWRSDLIAGVDSSDGSGALDTMAAVNIAKNRSSWNAGWQEPWLGRRYVAQV